MADRAADRAADQTGIEVSLLGTISATRAGEALPVRPGNDTTILVLLCLSAGHSASMDWILDQLYGDREGAPASARTVVHGAVSRLRRGGIPVSTSDSTSGGAYRLDADAIHLDLRTFSEHVRVARDYAERDPLRTLAATQGALAVWRGPEPFVGCRAATLIDAERERLLRARAEVEDLRLRALLDLDRPREVVADAARLLAVDPSRTESSVLLATAHARTGDFASVGRVRSELQRHLAEHGLDVPTAVARRFDDLWIGGHRTTPSSRAATPIANPTTTATSQGRVAAPFGREQERNQLLGISYDALEGGGRTAVHVVGQSGVGKSWLLDALRPELAAQGWWVLQADRARHTLASTSSAVAELLRALERADGAASTSVPPATVDLVRRALSASTGVERSEDVQAAQNRRADLVDAVVSVVHAAANVRSIAVVVDDLATIDDLSADIVDQLCRRECSGTLLVVAAMIADESGTFATSGQRRFDADHRIGVAPFDRGLSAAYLREQAPLFRHLLRDEALDHCFDVTEGLPLRLAELGRSLRALQPSVGPTELVSLLPASFAAAIGQRLDRLDASARRTVAAAAVCGARFHADDVAELLQVDVDRVVGDLDAALGAGLVVEEPTADRYRFRHDAVHAVVLDQPGANQRRRWHLRRAERLRSAGEPAEALEHLLAAGTVDTTATDFASDVRSAVNALVSSVAFRRAVELAERAVALVDGSTLRSDLLISLGVALAWAGSRTRSDAVLAEARSIARSAGDVVRVAEALLCVVDSFRIVFVDAQVVDDLEWAWTNGDGLSADLRANLGARVLASSHHPAFARDVAVTAEELLALDGLTPRTRCQVLGAAHVVSRCGPGFVEPKIMRELWQVAGNDEELSFTASSAAMVDHGRRGEFTELEALAADVLGRAKAYRWPRHIWSSLCALSTVARCRGDYERAEALAQEAMQLGVQFNATDAQAAYGMHIFQVCWERSELGALVELFRPKPDGSQLLLVQLFFIHALLQQGSRSEARKALLAIRTRLADPKNDEARIVTVCLSLAATAELGVELGDDVFHQRVLNEASRYSGQWISFGIPVAVLGSVDSLLAKCRVSRR